MNNTGIELLNVRGGYDYLPSAMAKRNAVIDQLKKRFECFGFLPLETTILCYHELLSYKYAGGSEILKEVYSLSDQGNRELGLRYDLTVPFCKVIGMNPNIPMPFKRYEIGKVFRDGPIKAGRAREFYQCDVDAVGINGQDIEAEFLNLAVLAYNDIGIDVEIRYSNRKFLNSLITACGFRPEQCSQITLEVDKLDKIGAKGVKNSIMNLEVNISENSTDKLLELLGASIEALKEELAVVESAKEGLNELLTLEDAINRLGISGNCRFVPSLARGLEIYTGTVWEAFDKQKRISSSLGGGGRYDKIITEFLNNGRTYPAVGMSFGLEPICAVLGGEENQRVNLIDLFIIPLDDRIAGMKLANEFRKDGLKVLVEMVKRKLNKSFSYADNESIPFVTVIGENELKSGLIKIKDMKTGESTEFSINAVKDIVSFINNKK